MVRSPDVRHCRRWLLPRFEWVKCVLESETKRFSPVVFNQKGGWKKVVWSQLSSNSRGEYSAHLHSERSRWGGGQNHRKQMQFGFCGRQTAQGGFLEQVSDLRFDRTNMIRYLKTLRFREVLLPVILQLRCHLWEKKASFLKVYIAELNDYCSSVSTNRNKCGKSDTNANYTT